MSAIPWCPPSSEDSAFWKWAPSTGFILLLAASSRGCSRLLIEGAGLSLRQVERDRREPERGHRWSLCPVIPLMVSWKWAQDSYICIFKRSQKPIFFCENH